MDPYCAAVWPEDQVPPEAVDCEVCGLYKQGTRMVWGEGNPAAPIMVILDNPGAREDREGNPFICGTRQTLQEAVHTAGLQAEHVYVTYVLKRRPIRAYDKIEVRQRCFEEHLLSQLADKRPKKVLCLGNVATQIFFGDPNAEVKRLRGLWHEARGFPTAVSYHPLAVRRRPNLRRHFIEDWTFFAQEFH